MRHLRVQSTLSQEVSLLFRGGLSDPRLEGVSLTSFELSPDGRLVRIGDTLTPEAAASGTRSVQEALARAGGYLRSQLAQHLDLKRTPQLRFIYIGVAERQPDSPEPDASLDEEGGPCAPRRARRPPAWRAGPSGGPRPLARQGLVPARAPGGRASDAPGFTQGVSAAARCLRGSEGPGPAGMIHG